MDAARRLQATKALVLVGIALSVTSYGAHKLAGVPELYPFFHWRLYSAPWGTTGPLPTHRFYIRPHDGAEWERLPVRETEAYPLKEYVWQFEALVAAAVADSLGQTDARQRLSVFAHEVAAPGAAAYRVVAEALDPAALLAGSTRYDTTTILTLDR